VIHGQPHLTLATTHGGYSTHHARATRLLVVTIVIAGHKCSLLMALLVPSLATLGALLGILDEDIGRCFPTAAGGQVKLGHSLPTAYWR
jgi:hypothetical protein